MFHVQGLKFYRFFYFASICIIFSLLFTGIPVQAMVDNDVQKVKVVGNDDQKVKKVAIIIDDLGDKMAGTKEILDLPVPLTVAVMPFLRTSKQDAEQAHMRGHDVIVHLPMESKYGKKRWLGPGAITTDLSDEEIKRRVHAAIDDIPHAIGINNHMGSRATSNPRVMRMVLEVCRERGMIYIDSKTSNRSVARSLAQETGVAYLENHIFLDDVASVSHISRQCDVILKNHLTKRNQCIAIGHVGRPGKKTAAALRKKLASMQDNDVTFVKISDLVPEYQWLK